MVPYLVHHTLLSVRKLTDAAYISIYDGNEVNIYDGQPSKIRISEAAVVKVWKFPVTKLFCIPFKYNISNLNTDTQTVGKENNQEIPSIMS